ncbi:MAG: hypothetical protein IK066_07660 [Kiritimatiellae bacterium]|nr:hypothetical protein [Kiritimatiellia bacterium]
MREDLNRVERWEGRLKAVFDEIDAELEENAALGKGVGYRRHPVRLPAGVTSNPEDDGLFEVGASFTAGIGSERGPGYVVTARIATLEDVEPGVQERLEEEVVRMLREKLPEAFSGKGLEVVRDGGGWKIVGDLGLD